MNHARWGAGLLALGALCGVAVRAARSNILVAGRRSQQIQNFRADTEDLSRMKDYAMILRFRRAGLLVRVPLFTKYYYLRRIPARHRYLRPWSKLFLDRLSRQFHARFGARLRVTALVRTVASQRALARRNPNAAAPYGDLRSSHLTGATVDISKRFMRPSHKDWMRHVLYRLHRRKVIYAVEEFHQPCFHVMVHKSYGAYVRSIGS